MTNQTKWIFLKTKMHSFFLKMIQYFTLPQKELKIKNTDEEPYFFNHYDPEALHKIIDTQHKVIEYQKKQDHKKYSVY